MSLRACLLGVAVLAAVPANAIDITQVRGRFNCPELDNQQDCATKAERGLLTAHRNEVLRDGDSLRIRLTRGRTVTLKDDNDYSYNAVEWSADGRFVAIRVQYFEGNGWKLLDRRNGALTDISGYLLFSPDRTKFVAATEDLDALYNLNVLDIYKITPEGIVRIFRGMPERGGDWAARDIVWDGETAIRFRHTKMKDNREVETPAKLILKNGKWGMGR